jgi:hypothetical protein
MPAKEENVTTEVIQLATNDSENWSHNQFQFRIKLS